MGPKVSLLGEEVIEGRGMESPVPPKGWKDECSLFRREG